MKKFLKRIAAFCNKTWYGHLVADFLRCIYASDPFNSKLKINNNGSIRIKKTVIGRNNVFDVGHNSLLQNVRVIVHGNNNLIHIGNGCKLGERTKLWIKGNDCEIFIGDGCTVTHDNEFLCQECGKRISIGNDCMFSHHINVRTSDSHPIFNEAGERVNYPQDVIIGNHVWVAPHSIIMKGVEICDGSIVGSCAVVTKSFPCNSLIVGVPAKKVRDDVRWERYL